MDGVGTPIIGRPRPLPGHDTPNPAHNTYTLNYEEPIIVGTGLVVMEVNEQQLYMWQLIRLCYSYWYRN